MRGRFAEILQEVAPDDTILLAVSGGIDSMSMAELFRSLSGPSRIAVAHCNFRLRGCESDADEALVRSWCASAGVRVHAVSFDTAVVARERSLSIEMAARELRYTWFASLCRRYGYSAVAVAHNADDNVETLLLNLLRGTGIKGASGMRRWSFVPEAVGAGLEVASGLVVWGSDLEDGVCGSEVVSGLGVGRSGLGAGFSDPVAGGSGLEAGRLNPKAPVRLFRPMLWFTRKEISDFAASCALPYRNDSSNETDVYKRNKIRHLVAPVLKEINPSYQAAFERSMRNFAQVAEIAEDYFELNRATVFLGRLEPDPFAGRIDIEKLKSLKHRSYMLFRLLEPCGFSSAALQSVSSLIFSSGQSYSGRRFYGSAASIVLSSSHIIINPSLESFEPVLVSGAGEYQLGGRRVVVDLLRRSFQTAAELRQPRGTTMISAGAVSFPFWLRPWREGDYMRPLGLGGRRKKLSDVFVDLKYSAQDKAEAAVLVADLEDSRVLALLGERLDESAKVAPGPDTQVISLKLTF